MFDLNSVKAIEHLDRHNTLERLKAFPDELKSIAQLARKIRPPKKWQSVTQIVICGMGGSGIAANIIQDLAIQSAQIPIVCHQDYTLPLYVSAQTLLICVSYSGNTAEVLNCARQAIEKKAQIFVITQEGTPLDSLTEEVNVPVFYITCELPPRFALAYTLIPIIGVLDQLGHTKNLIDSIEMASVQLTRLREEIKETKVLAQNPAKALATDIAARLPVIVATTHFSAVAKRFTTQINENAKAHAFYATIPEFAHNAIEANDHKNDLFYLLVSSQFDSYEHKVALDGVRQVLDKNKISSITLELQGSDQLQHILFGIYLLDFVSFYLAMIRQENPFYTENIVYYKKYLKEHLG